MHFQLLAVLPRAIADQDVLGTLRDLLAAYHVEREVAAHEERCFCVGRAAMAAAQAAAAGTEGRAESEEDIDRFQAALATAFARHPLRDEADPACPECRGTGRRTTTRNPLAYWSSLGIGKPLLETRVGSGPRMAGQEILEAWPNLTRLPFAIWTHEGGWTDRWGSKGLDGGYRHVPEEPWRTVSRRALVAYGGSDMVLLDCHL